MERPDCERRRPEPVWLATRQFGLSWQIVPKQLVQLIGSPDRAAAGRAMQAMLTMTKIDVAELQRAYDNT